jgi:hypothetical protein
MKAGDTRRGQGAAEAARIALMVLSPPDALG